MSNVTCLINDKIRLEIQNINSYQFLMMINYYVVSEYENDYSREKIKKELDFVHIFLFKYEFL